MGTEQQLIILKPAQLREIIAEAKQDARPIMTPPKAAWSTAECARYLGISENRVRELADTGSLPYFRTGKCYKFHPHIVMMWEGVEG